MQSRGHLSACPASGLSGRSISHAAPFPLHSRWLQRCSRALNNATRAKMQHYMLYVILQRWIIVRSPIRRGQTPRYHAPAAPKEPRALVRTRARACTRAVCRSARHPVVSRRLWDSRACVRAKKCFPPWQLRDIAFHLHVYARCLICLSLSLSLSLFSIFIPPHFTLHSLVNEKASGECRSISWLSAV